MINHSWALDALNPETRQHPQESQRLAVLLPRRRGGRVGRQSLDHRGLPVDTLAEKMTAWGARALVAESRA